jgi:hypothetical protein
MQLLLISSLVTKGLLVYAFCVSMLWNLVLLFVAIPARVGERKRLQYMNDKQALELKTAGQIIFDYNERIEVESYVREGLNKKIDNLLMQIDESKRGQIQSGTSSDGNSDMPV